MEPNEADLEFVQEISRLDGNNKRVVRRWGCALQQGAQSLCCRRQQTRVTFYCSPNLLLYVGVYSNVLES